MRLVPALACLALVPALAAADPVRVSVQTMTFPVERSGLGEASRGGWEPGTGYYPIRDKATKKPVVVRETLTTEVVVLDNGLVEAWVAPGLGGRLLRAVDKQTKVDYFWRRMKDGEWVFDDMLAWNPGGVKASFPFFEHGTGLRVPAGWRTVTRPDGAVVVAMEMRFTGNRAKADIDRYGRYGDEPLTTMVVVRPGSSAVEWIQRKDNPNPTPRSDRMWNDASFPLPVIPKTVTEIDTKTKEPVTKQVQDTDAVDKVFSFLFPARWVVDHGPTAVHTSPHWTAPTNWNISHFAVDAPHRFAGGWYQAEDLNRLRINDTEPGKGPGVKLWTAPGPDMFEVWGGEGWVFEYPGDLQPAWKPTAFSHRFWIAQGIGQADIANDLVAAGVEGTAFTLVASRNGTAVVRDGTGAEVARGAIGPHTVLAGAFDGKRLVVALDGAPALDQTFPIDRPVPAKDTPVPAEHQHLFERLKAGAATSGDRFFERQCYGRNQGQPGIVNAMEQFAKHTAKSDQTASLATVAFRLGELEHAERLAKLADDGEGDLVLALIALEQDRAPDFGRAGWQADVLRALVARKAGDTAAAVALVKGYLAKVPDAWYPRLFLAAWTTDAALAQALADENPASPEAQLVLQMLGRPAELEQTLRGRPEAIAELAIFRDQVERGVWKPVPRFPQALLRSKGW